MADIAKGVSDNQVGNVVSPVDLLVDEYVMIDGEAHVLNYDTNILNLDEYRELSPGEELADAGGEIAELPTTTTVSTEEDADIELSPGGILDEETIGRGLSNIGRSADALKQVYLHCTVPGFNLVDISALENYTELQKVEIPYNQLTDLSPLSHLPYLLILDASHNKLTTVLDFTPPRNLKEVDLSFNEIEVMADLSNHHYMTTLNLDNNHITVIAGLEGCKRLSHLSLAHNKIEKIQGLQGLPLQYLNLCHNEIKRIENLESLTILRQINLAGNNIRSLKGIEDHSLLESVDLEDNEVIDITEINYIKELAMMRQLNLLRNPIQELPDYRLSILFQIQRLTELDRHKVEVEEKEIFTETAGRYLVEERVRRTSSSTKSLPAVEVAASNMFNPPAEVIAARDHVMHVVYSFLQPSRVWDSTLPSIETPYPMLVLVGPQGSGKKDLALKLVDEFADYFGYGVSHTTRKPRKEETASKDYHFVTEEKFEMDIKMGQFVQTYQYHGNWYGLQMESIETIAREGLACVVHMEIEGVLTLKNTYFEPRYVLVMPLDEDAHEKRLRDRGIYSEAQIEYTLMRSDMYKNYNQIHPGFFDMMINSDDIQDSYKRVRRLVMDYLGIGITSTPASETGEDMRGDTDQNVATQMGTRTWSRPSINETVSQPYTRTKAAQSPILSGRGIVEEESLKRRQSAAKEAVAGFVPPLFEQLVSSYPKTAPQSVDDQMGLDGAPLVFGQDGRSYSAPVNPARPPSSDSSEDRSGASSSLSGLTSASEVIQRAGSPEAVTATDKGPQLPTELVNPLELLSESAQGLEHRPPSNPRAPSQGSLKRPGSDRHKILPPISPKLNNNLRLVELK